MNRNEIKMAFFEWRAGIMRLDPFPALHEQTVHIDTTFDFRRAVRVVGLLFDNVNLRQSKGTVIDFLSRSGGYRSVWQQWTTRLASRARHGQLHVREST